MYLFKPYPGDGASPAYHARTDDSQSMLVTVEGGHAAKPLAADAAAAATTDHAAPARSLITRGREHLALARELAGELVQSQAPAGAQPVEAQHMERALQEWETGFREMGSALDRLGRLGRAMPALATGPRAFRMFDHVYRQYESALKRACNRTFDALVAFESAIENTTRLRGRGAPRHATDSTAPALRPLHQVIAAAKGLVSILMALLMVPDRLARYWSPATETAADPHAGSLERAAAAWNEVRQQCADMMGTLRDADADADAGHDPDFGDPGQCEPAALEADQKIRSFFALFDLLNLIDDTPPYGPLTAEETRMLATNPPIHTRMTEDLAQALRTVIARYPQDQQAALLSLHALAFPRSAEPLADAVAPPVPLAPAEADDPALAPSAVPQDPPEPGPTPRTWGESARIYGPALASGLLYVAMSLM